MNPTLIKALGVMMLGAVLLARSIALSRRDSALYSLLQVLGAASLIIVVTTHIFEAVGAFPWMGWGRADSLGHYIDLSSAILALTLFPLGYLIHAMKAWRSR